MKSPVTQVLKNLHQRYASLHDGKVADYIPELAKVDPKLFGICIATRDGHLYEVGDTRHKFTIQSISKALSYGLALEDRGEDHVTSRIGVEPSGDAFNAISLKPGNGAPFNPMINAGAIATCGQVLKKDGQTRIDRIREYLSRCAIGQLDIDEDVYRSESQTGHRNRAIGWMLRNFDIIEEEPRDILETYFQQCSLRVNCADLAVMAATLANQGCNPVTGERAIAHEYVDNVLGVMASCGMYDWSGEWIYRVGLPAKSGVGGGILAVLPGQLGIGVFSPPLDDQGNSVRGIKVCMDLARELALHMFNPSAVPQPALRRSYNASQVNSRRRLPAPVFKALRSYGDRIRVMELQGPLLFSTFEPVIRELVKQAAYCQHVILNFANVFSVDGVSLRMLREVRQQLDDTGVRLLCCHAGRHGKALEVAGLGEDALFPSEDAALEACEDAVLEKVMPHHTPDVPPVALSKCSLFSTCDEDELQLLEERMEHRSFATGETIIHTGGTADELFVLSDGTVEVRLLLGNNRYQRLDVFSAGMSFGELAFLDGSPRSADVVTTAPVTCRVIRRSLFDVLGREHPALKAKILHQFALLLCERLRQANIEISALRG
ncbi:glutaminase A [Luteolibacter arcticus]|uniref:Glutaminase n=1 Tax=Luteolibacter arcticus TaxID=1581411 RepID=A0ABT3GFR5_9BACT|nr:glutaminase A [Luteolibacter arcticus]MCW1922145.1 glutaminase A [Luteolibacter arcticus]